MSMIEKTVKFDDLRIRALANAAVERQLKEYAAHVAEIIDYLRREPEGDEQIFGGKYKAQAGADMLGELRAKILKGIQE